MRSKEDIEQALKQAHLDIEINTETDRTILNKLVEAHETSQRATARRMVPKFAVAAIIMMAALLATHSVLHNAERVTVDSPAKPRIETLNLVSLNAAYRRGGMDAVDAQYQEVFSPELQPKRMSIETLLAELTNNGES